MGEKTWVKTGAYLARHIPDRIRTQAVDGTVGGVDGVELDAEDEKHLRVLGVDVDPVADSTEGASDTLDSVSDLSKVGRSELPDGELRVGHDEDGKLHLALELVETSRVLGLGECVLVAGDPIDREAMLLKNVLGLGRLTKVIKAKMNTPSIDGHAVGETLVLGGNQSSTRDQEDQTTYELHLVLDTEQLMLGVHASTGAIGKLGDEVKTREVRLVVLGELVDKDTLDMWDRQGEDVVVLVRGVADLLARGDDSGLAEAAAVMKPGGAVVADKLRRVEGRIGTAIGAGGRTNARR